MNRGAFARAARFATRALAIVGLLATAALAAFALLGISARSAPSALEAWTARRARALLIPRAAQRRVNPVPASAEVLDEGLRHWADHCAICHGNDGRGDVPIGRGLYPRAPDMTLPATQDLSDGALFWIIENGVKLTGMPAWGTSAPDDDDESWELVHAIRHLPTLEAAELEMMKRLNPISRQELEHQQAIERFLAGDDSETSAARENPDP